MNPHHLAFLVEDRAAAVTAGRLAVVLNILVVDDPPHRPAGEGCQGIVRVHGNAREAIHRHFIAFADAAIFAGRRQLHRLEARPFGIEHQGGHIRRIIRVGIILGMDGDGADHIEGAGILVLNGDAKVLFSEFFLQVEDLPRHMPVGQQHPAGTHGKGGADGGGLAGGGIKPTDQEDRLRTFPGHILEGAHRQDRVAGHAVEVAQLLAGRLQGVGQVAGVLPLLIEQILQGLEACPADGGILLRPVELLLQGVGALFRFV